MRKYYYLVIFFSITLFLTLYKRYKMKAMFNIWEKRNCDPEGCGHYGASRGGGKRKHLGLDVICSPNDIATAPYNCKIKRANFNVYSDSSEFKGIELEPIDLLQKGINIKIFYIVPFGNLKVGDTVAVGQPFGIVQNRKKNTSMKNHIHVEVWENGKNRNPELYFKF